MNVKNLLASAFLCIIPLCDARAQIRPGAAADPYTTEERLDYGIALYEQGRWGEAILELRRAEREAESAADRAEAFFWIAVSEHAAGEYENALVDLERVGRADPSNVYTLEAPYHKARAFYCLKRYREAIRFFQAYADSIHIDGRYINGVRYEGWERDIAEGNIQVDYNRKASALYWIGECYYAMEDYKVALSYYEMIVEQYMKSHKYENSMNRIAMIKQKMIEDELRAVLKAKEDAPSAAAAAQQRAAAQTVTGNPAYDEALLAYQNRIAPYLMLKALGEEEKNAPAAARPPQQPPPQTPAAAARRADGADPSDIMVRLLRIKTGALEIMDRLMSTLNAYEMLER